MSSPPRSQPVLSWPGRAPLDASLPAPAALHTWELHPAAGPPLLAAETRPAPAGRLMLGDNLAVGAALLPELEGRVDLIYLDPPFGTGGRFRMRGQPGEAGSEAYSDAWAGGLTGYLDMLQPRLQLAHRLLAPHGSLYVHLDPTASHSVKVLLDEIFSPECFQREIVWRIGWISGYKGTVRNWVRNHDVILYYTRDPGHFVFHKAYVPHLPGYSRRGGGEGQGLPIDDVWNGSPAEHALTGAASLDSIQIKSFSAEKSGYETQKNESLLERIIEASSDPGALVCDLFAGSGTTLCVAERLGRRWLGCDVRAAAVHVARKRLLALDRRGAFAVMATEAAAEAGGGASEAEVEARDGVVRLRLLRPDTVDYWAVEWETPAAGPPGEGAGPPVLAASGDRPLRPGFASFRRYSTREPAPLATEAAHRRAGAGPVRVRAHLAGPDGIVRRYRPEVEV